MATEVIIPALGVVVEKVKILKWLKSEGDPVTEKEPLLEVESDKVNTEIVAPMSGILGRILYPEGTEVPITKVVAVIVSRGEAVPDAYRPKGEAGLSGSPFVEPSVPLTKRPVAAVKAAPVARKLAEEKGIDLVVVKPTGPHGTIMKKDVEAYLASLLSRKEPVTRVAEEVQAPSEARRVTEAEAVKKVLSEKEGLFGEIIPMHRIRKVIARRMADSAFTAPHIHFFTEAHMERVLHLRTSIQEEFEKRFNANLSINDFLIKAVALAIREYPLLNASAQGEEIHIHPDINIGLAVALEDGLIVPALPQADKLGLGAIAQTRTDLVDRARKGKLKLDEIERGTFTISSLANFDITFFTAILNPPQSGILTLGKKQDQLYLEGNEIKTRKIACFGLSVDHRIIDGAVAAAFLQTVKKIMENPGFYFLKL